MLEIHVNISSPDLIEVARLLARTRGAPAVETAASTQSAGHAVVTPAAPVASATPPAAVPVVPVTTPVPSYTVDELATAGAVLAQQGKTAELQGLLAKYSIGSIMELDRSLYGAFATDLRGLGAQI